jgi:hypothetical protein
VKQPAHASCDGLDRFESISIGSETKSQEVTMSTESVSRPEATTQVLKLARFAILSTLAFGIVLLIATVITNGKFDFLNENILKSLLYVIGAEVVVAIVAATCLAIWRKPE